MAAIMPDTAGNDVAKGTPNADTFGPSGGNDDVLGGGGGDTLRGGRGNDNLVGGTGPDLLGSGDGNNNLTGGPGADTFEIDIGAGAGNEINLITDFEDGVDRIHLVFDTGRLGTARVDAIEAVAAASGPVNALNEADTNAVTVLDGDISDVLQLDFFFVPGADSTDVLNVAGVNQLELEANPAGTDLFLV